jgi:hypothetical protein
LLNRYQTFNFDIDLRLSPKRTPVLLSPLRINAIRRSTRNSTKDLGNHQPAKPPGQHRANPLARNACAEEGGRSRGGKRFAQEELENFVAYWLTKVDFFVQVVWSDSLQ